MRNVVLALVCLAVGAWLGLWLRGLLERSRGRARNARGKCGERDAERVLEAHGYRIRERQARSSYQLEVDGLTESVSLIFDFLVERGGELFVAEVKTGSGAQLRGRSETRRQLLEYQLATQARQVLLVDPEAETITCVAFPLTHAEPRATSSLGLLAIAAALLGLLALGFWRLR